MRRTTVGLLLGVLVVGGLVTSAETADAQERDDLEIEGAPAPHAYRWFSGGGSYLGVFLSEVDAAVASRLRLDEERGALVRRVVKESPAEKAGLKKDDVVLSWNGTRVESSAQLERLVHETPPGRTVHLAVARDGKQREIDVEIGERKGSGALAFGPGSELQERMQELGKRLGHLKEFRFDLEGPDAGTWVDSLGDGEEDVHVFMSSSGRGRLGVAIENLSPQLAGYFGLRDRSGVLISSVRKDSPADKAGLRAGDVIVSVGGDKVEDPGDVMRLLSRADKGPLEVGVVRDKKERSVTVELGERSRGGRFFFRPRGEEASLPGLRVAPGAGRNPAPSSSPARQAGVPRQV